MCLARIISYLLSITWFPVLISVFQRAVCFLISITCMLNSHGTTQWPWTQHLYLYLCDLQASGRRSRTNSESSTHSGGRERSNSAVKQASPPPPSIPEQPRKEESKKIKKDSPKKVHMHMYTHTHTRAFRFSLFPPISHLIFHCWLILFLSSHRVVGGWTGSIGRGRMRLTCQMTKINL